MKIISRSRSTIPKFDSEIIIYEYASGRRVSVFHNIVNERYFIRFIENDNDKGPCGPFNGPFKSLREAFDNLH